MPKLTCRMRRRRLMYALPFLRPTFSVFHLSNNIFFQQLCSSLLCPTADRLSIAAAGDRRAHFKKSLFLRHHVRMNLIGLNLLIFNLDVAFPTSSVLTIGIQNNSGTSGRISSPRFRRITHLIISAIWCFTKPEHGVKKNGKR